MRRRRALGDPAVVAVAGVAVVGALVAPPVPVAVGVVAVGLAWWWGRPAAVVVAIGVLAAGLGHAAAVAAAPLAPRPVTGVATLVTDPVRDRGSVRAEVRLDGVRLEVVAGGSAAGALAPRLAGEQVRLRGTARPRPEGAEWLARRHVVGRVAVDGADDLVPAGAGDPASSAANRLRRLLERGAEGLDPTTRSLFTGFVVGDDREVPDAVRADFRTAGLTHLLAVSGANVAFVLALAAPLLARVGLRSRLVATLALLAWFALLTRFEPSVLRATAMAGVAAVAATAGWPVSGARLLGLAVTGLVLVDPLLAGSTGFQLSVAASAGILVGARPIAARVPGPRPVADAVGVTVSAQLAVAPLLVPLAGGLPVVALPANLLAAPAAGPVMVWGLTGGAVAGVVGGPVATVAHLPTRLLLGWVAGVARVAASAPLGDLGPAHLAVLVLLGAAAVAAGRRARPPVPAVVGRAAAVAAALVVLLAALVLPGPSPGAADLGPGARLTVSAAGSSALVLDGRARIGSVLAGLRDRGVRRLDVVVVRTDSRGAAVVAAAVVARTGAPTLVAPSADRLPGATVPPPGWELRRPGLALRVTAAGPSLEVSIAADVGVPSAGAVRSSRPRVPDHAGARGPPLRHHRPGRGDGHPQPHARLLLRQGQLLGLRRLPPQGGGPRGRRRRLPRRGRGQGRAR